MRTEPVSPKCLASALPYGNEFRFVDRVIALDAPSSIMTETEYSLSRWPLGAHFRGGPAIVPGAILAEHACQSALVLWALTHGGVPPYAPMLIGRLRSEFRAPVMGGAVVRMSVWSELATENHFAFRAAATCGAVEVATFYGVGARLQKSRP